jgi:tetratricopeptide (TPR) repeat protein
MLDVWDLKSQALQKLGRNEEALSSLKTGIGHSPEGATHYLAAVASLCVQMGRLDEALTNAELARDRGDPAADDVLSRVHLARKDHAAAEAAALSVVEKRPSRRLPYLVLARVAIARGDLAGALARLDRVAELTARGEGLPLSGSHYLRGDTLGRMGRLDEARKELREEVRLFPPNLDAWTSLAALEASLGSLDAVRRAVEEMVEANPGVPAHLAAVKALAVVGDAEGAAYWRRAGQARFPGERRFRAGG